MLDINLYFTDTIGLLIFPPRSRYKHWIYKSWIKTKFSVDINGSRLNPGHLTRLFAKNERFIYFFSRAIKVGSELIADLIRDISQILTNVSWNQTSKEKENIRSHMMLSYFL